MLLGGQRETEPEMEEQFVNLIVEIFSSPGPSVSAMGRNELVAKKVYD